MKASRPTKIITNASDAPVTGAMGFLRRQANNILTVILVIAAIAMLIRWRMRTAEAAKQQVNNELTNAQDEVSKLRDAMFQGQVSGPELLKYLNERENAASASISNVLNNSDADARMRGAAYVARGDMYWSLANLPDLPGSATQPSLQLSEPSTTLLQKSSDAYSEVVKNSTYADQHEELAAAHLGLAAIAENRMDWATAEAELNAVTKDSKALPVLVERAQSELDNISSLKAQQYYVAPPEGTPASAVIKHASTQPTSGPTTMPSTMPTSMPATTKPTTKPATRVARNDPLRDEVEYFYHYAKISRYDVAIAEGKKILARRADPEQWRLVFVETAKLHQDQLDQILSRWQKNAQLADVTTQLIGAMNGAQAKR